MITYRKTQKDEWVAYGPVSEVRVGPCTVHKANGATKTEHVASLGKTFTVDGRTMVYGYLSKSTPRPAQQPRRHMCDECGSRPATTTARDLSGILGNVCARCKQGEGCLSFA